MDYSKEVIAEIAGKTGIDTKSIEYDIMMTDLINDLFYEVMDKDIPVFLYGGTALNRGYFGKEQRLSIDLDLESPKKLLSANIRIIKAALKRNGYSIETPAYATGRRIFYAFKDNSAKIRIEVAGQRLNDIKPIQLKLYPMLRFYGLPVPYSVAKSYEFEYLLAGKIDAFSRRMLYKDLYDVFHALQMLKDEKKLAGYLDALGNAAHTDILAEALHSTSQAKSFDTDADMFYRALVQKPEAYSGMAMLEAVHMRLESMHRRFRTDSKE